MVAPSSAATRMKWHRPFLLVRYLGPGHGSIVQEVAGPGLVEGKWAKGSRRGFPFARKWREGCWWWDSCKKVVASGGDKYCAPILISRQTEPKESGAPGSLSPKIARPKDRVRAILLHPVQRIAQSFLVHRSPTKGRSAWNNGAPFEIPSAARMRIPTRAHNRFSKMERTVCTSAQK